MRDEVVELMQDLYSEAGAAYWRFSDIINKTDIDPSTLEEILEELEEDGEVRSQWNGDQACYMYDPQW